MEKARTSIATWFRALRNNASAPIVSDSSEDKFEVVGGTTQTFQARIAPACRVRPGPGGGPRPALYSAPCCTLRQIAHHALPTSNAHH